MTQNASIGHRGGLDFRSWSTQLSRVKKTQKRKMPKPPVETPEQKKRRQSWEEQQRELDRKINDLLYEDRNGFRPPRPWYEDDSSFKTVAIPRFKSFHSTKTMHKESLQGPEYTQVYEEALQE